MNSIFSVSVFLILLALSPLLPSSIRTISFQFNYKEVFWCSIYTIFSKMVYSNKVSHFKTLILKYFTWDFFEITSFNWCSI